MNDQQQTTPIPNQPRRLKQLIDKFTPVVKMFWLKLSQSKFYTNKKIFFPVSISLGLIVLMVLLVLIFGGKKTIRPPKSTPTPTPTSVKSTNSGSGSDDQLSQIEQKLFAIKKNINDLDVKQSRLQPPSLNFNIKF